MLPDQVRFYIFLLFAQNIRTPTTMLVLIKISCDFPSGLLLFVWTVNVLLLFMSFQSHHCIIDIVHVNEVLQKLGGIWVTT